MQIYESLLSSEQMLSYLSARDLLKLITVKLNTQTDAEMEIGKISCQIPVTADWCHIGRNITKCGVYQTLSTPSRRVF